MRLGFGLFLLLSTMAGAQAPAEEPRHPVQAFEEMIDVRAVNLEAVVTDSRGRRVTGLSVEDFKLFVDGVETPITLFSPVEEERRIAGEVGSSEKPATEPSWQSRNILVFLDEASMMKSRRNLVLHSVIKQIEDLASGDQMAVVAFNGLGLEVLSDWTSDRERLVSVLKAVRQRPSSGIYVDVARRQELSHDSFQALVESQDGYGRNPGGTPFTNQTVPASPKGRDDDDWQQPARFQRAQLFNPLGFYLEAGEAAAVAMRGMSAPSGRKMMMLLTEGFQYPMFAQPVIQEAQRQGYSLYPVDVKGIDTFVVQNDVAFDTPQPFRLISTGVDLDMNYTLTSMAAATGGKASINSSRTAALERLIEDSSSYYLIGFSPTWRGDDRRHRIRLTVSRPGLRVRTRDSYVDSSRRTRLELAADASLLLGRSSAEQRLILTAGETQGSISITLGVPVESLAFAPREKGFRAETPFSLVVLDDKGERKHVQESWLAVDVEKLPLRGTFARFQFSVVAGERAERIVVTVHDALSGEALWGEASLTPR